MAPRKRGPARKSKRTTAPAARPRPGHNKPPESPPPQPAVPDIRSWQGDDQTAANIVRQAARQRARHTAHLGGMSVGSPHPLAQSSAPPSADVTALHQQMLKHVAALQEMLANLPPPPRPLDDNEIVEIKEELARLEASSAVPSPLPSTTESPLRKFGEKILTQLAVQQGSSVAKAAGKQFWETFGDQLIATAKTFGDWIAGVLTGLG
jgi:hypothetical protein